MAEFTPTQQRILRVLSDGEPHTRKELHECLEDELGAITNIKMHMSRLRKILRPRGEDILCVIGQGMGIFYRHVRLLASAVDGRK